MEFVLIGMRLRTCQNNSLYYYVVLSAFFTFLFNVQFSFGYFNLIDILLIKYVQLKYMLFNNNNIWLINNDWYPAHWYSGWIKDLQTWYPTRIRELDK